MATAMLLDQVVMAAPSGPPAAPHLANHYIFPMRRPMRRPVRRPVRRPMRRPVRRPTPHHLVPLAAIYVSPRLPTVAACPAEIVSQISVVRPQQYGTPLRAIPALRLRL